MSELWKKLVMPSPGGYVGEILNVVMANPGAARGHVHGGLRRLHRRPRFHGYAGHLPDRVVRRSTSTSRSPRHPPARLHRQIHWRRVPASSAPRSPTRPRAALYRPVAMQLAARRIARNPLLTRVGIAINSARRWPATSARAQAPVQRGRRLRDVAWHLASVAGGNRDRRTTLDAASNDFEVAAAAGQDQGQGRADRDFRGLRCPGRAERGGMTRSRSPRGCPR
jgi:hypothetical protein